ncbi:MAG: RebB family R body protein [Alphaproteobacteria bacterium]|nr:RebB family R body protein [Alphaproteobacteria bacterium]
MHRLVLPSLLLSSSLLFLACGDKDGDSGGGADADTDADGTDTDTDTDTDGTDTDTDTDADGTDTDTDGGDSGSTDGGTDTRTEGTLEDSASGVVVAIPEGALPEGMTLGDLTLTVDEPAPETWNPAVYTGFAPIVRLEPVGTELLAEIEIQMPLSVPSSLLGSPTVDPTIAAAIASGDTASINADPGLSAVSVYDYVGAASALAYHNAVAPQQQANFLLQASTTQGVNGILDAGYDPSLYVAKYGDSGSGSGVLPAPGTFRAERADDGTVVVFGVDHLNAWAFAYTLMDGDGNGIHDIEEGPADSDDDGAWDFEDWDDDGDRVADELDGGLDDPDGDDLPGMKDDDRDGDGVADGYDECAASAACDLAWRLGNQRAVCNDGWTGGAAADVPVSDTVTVAHEWLVDAACPTEGAVASCVQDGELPVTLWLYVDDADVAAAFCASCEGAEVSPGGFCG